MYGGSGNRRQGEDEIEGSYAFEKVYGDKREVTSQDPVKRNNKHVNLEETA